MQARRKRILAVAGVAVAAILVVVVVSMVVYPQNESPSSRPCLGPGNCLFPVTGEIAINSDQGAGMIILTVVNHANFPFINISLVDATPILPGLTGFTPFTFDGRVINALHVLGIGNNSTGYYSFAYGGTGATSYTLTLAAVMSNGQTITEKASIISDS